MTELRRLLIIVRLLAKNFVRRLMGGNRAPDHTEAFSKAVRDFKAVMPVDAAKTISTFDISGTQAPWLDTGIDLAPGDEVSLFSVGRGYMSEALNIWVPSQMQLWHRIGEDGPVARGARATNTFSASKADRLYLAGLFPNAWKDESGGLVEPDSVYEKSVGGVSACLVHWASDAHEALEKIAQQGHTFAVDEIDRMAHEIGTPDGWSYLWEIGKGEIYDQRDSENGPAMRCRTRDDAGILQKNVDCPLTPTTRLKWKWKVDALPSRLAEDTVPTHDYLSIAVEFENGRDLSYFWSSTLPEEMSFHCPLPNWTHRETHFVIRSGRDDFGEWISEDRNIYEDYEKAIGDPPARIVRVWFISVSIFQKGSGDCEYAEIVIENGADKLRVLEAPGVVA
jgi:hypothetical protein